MVHFLYDCQFLLLKQFYAWIKLLQYVSSSDVLKTDKSEQCCQNKGGGYYYYFLGNFILKWWIFSSSSSVGYYEPQTQFLWKQKTEVYRGPFLKKISLFPYL